MRRLMSHDGFSMVEIIIVIAIMAILAGALAPTLIKYVNKSRMTTDINNADNIAKAASLALVDKEVAEYVFTQTMPFSVDIENLSSSDKYQSFLLENLGTAPKVKYTKNGATTYQITIYQDTSSSIAYKVEVTAKGASVTSTTGMAANPQGDGAMLYPEVDDQYNQ